MSIYSKPFKLTLNMFSNVQHISVTITDTYINMYLSPFAIRDVISFLPGNPKQLHQPNCFYCNPAYCSVIKKNFLKPNQLYEKYEKRNPNGKRSVTKVRLFLVLQSNPTNVIAKCFNWAKNETQERQKKNKKKKEEKKWKHFAQYK